LLHRENIMVGRRKPARLRLYRADRHTTIAQPYRERPSLGFAVYASRLADGQARQQLLRRAVESRMPPLRRNLAERGKHEPSLVQPRMRQHQAPCRAKPTVVIEQVQIESTRRITLPAHPPETRFEGEQVLEQ